MTLRDVSPLSGDPMTTQSTSEWALGITDRARPMGFSACPRHEALIQAIRLERAKRDHKVPKVSEIVQDAIEEMGLRELGAVRFAQVMANAS